MLPVDSLVFQSWNVRILLSPVATHTESGVKFYPLPDSPDRMRTEE